MATYTLKYVEKKPLSFSVPVVAAAGAFAGIFVGAAQGSIWQGILAGAVLMAILTFLAQGVLSESMEKPFRWGMVVLFAAGGYVFGEIPGIVVGAIFGVFYGWFIYWIG